MNEFEGIINDAVDISTMGGGHFRLMPGHYRVRTERNGGALLGRRALHQASVTLEYHQRRAPHSKGRRTFAVIGPRSGHHHVSLRTDGGGSCTKGRTCQCVFVSRFCPLWL
jgi:hypothetical protein